MQSRNVTFRRLGAFLVILIVSVFVVLWATDRLPQIDSTMIENWVARAGPWGPVLIVGLMTVSIVASPIPSAPVAMVSGAAYGHYAGAIYVAIGSEIGAIAAFLIARYLGRDLVERMLGEKAARGMLGSQNLLMLTVFGSRLLPFISFDALSYAAGLSRLHLWRFMVATLAGILPASFVLAHLGAKAKSGGLGNTTWLVLGLGLVTAIPLLVAALWKRTGGIKTTKP